MNPAAQSPTNSVHPARQQRILRLREVKAKTGFGRSTIYAPTYIQRGASGEFPRSIRIGARAVGWLESDIDQWIETRRIGAAYGRGMRLSNSVKARQLLSLFIQQMGELATQKPIRRQLP